MTLNTPTRRDFVRGDATGLTIPAHGEALRLAGEEFLTKALHTFASLPPNNRVSRITRCEPFSGGNSGQKLSLSVEYAHADSNLHTDLFVKFSRDFSDAFRDRRRQELAAEVRFASLCRLPQFPISVPTPYFADFNDETGTGLLITQRIAFGSNGIEPLHTKCRDHELADPLGYYRAIITSLARLAAAGDARSLAPQADAQGPGPLASRINALFPFDPEAAAAADPIPWSAQQLRELITRYREFAAQCPQLLPSNITTPEFISRLETESVLFLRHEAWIKRYLQSKPEFIALSHYNANIDNAWFWRDPSGALQCGLLDWGRVRQMNVAYALWGSLCAADVEVWDNHLDELLELFTSELHGQGGPLLSTADLRLHLSLYAATMGLAMLIQAPTLVLSRLPEAANASGPIDPIFQKDPVVHGFLHVFTTFLNLWQTQDFGASLRRLLDSHPQS